ncbi:hypothetical protein BJX62DRAFT_204408 [Aspergillus germanicus]
MESSTALHHAPAPNKHKERIAHIVWAAHILSYLTMKTSQPPVHDTNNEPDYYGNGDTDQTSNCESDYRTERAEVLSGPSDSVRRKFRSGMREGEHGVVVHVARNAGFTTKSDNACLDPREYCQALAEYLAGTSTSVEGTYEPLLPNIL